ncbi:L-lactate dehydrogenase, partial [Bacillus thuringiensis]
MNKNINRVVLIGTGAVGCSYAYCMINQGLAEEFVLVDVNEARAEGEAMDLS